VGTPTRIALTVAALVALGVFVALIGANTVVVAFDEPLAAGHVGVQAALALAIVLGWALLSGVEAVWKDEPDDDNRTSSEWWAPFTFAALPRIFVGVPLVLVILGIDFGLEALGVGLGGS
jgi:heme A synthase